MMVANLLLPEPIMICEDSVAVLVIENPIALRKCVSDLLAQSCGEKGEYVFSENYEPIEFHKRVEFLPDVFDVEIGGKRLSAQINTEAARIIDSYGDDYTRVAEAINSLAFRVISELDFEAGFAAVDDPMKIIKLIEIFVDTSDMSFCEKLIEYMRLCRKYLKKDIFIFLRLRSCLSDEEKEAFYLSLRYEKFMVLLIEDHIDSPATEAERITIVDGDLCVI